MSGIPVRSVSLAFFRGVAIDVVWSLDLLDDESHTSFASIPGSFLIATALYNRLPPTFLTQSASTIIIWTSFLTTRNLQMPPYSMVTQPCASFIDDILCYAYNYYAYVRCMFRL